MGKKLFKPTSLKSQLRKASGISSAKRKVAKITGIPTTKSGRKRKVKKMMGISTTSKNAQTIRSILKLFKIK